MRKQLQRLDAKKSSEIAKLVKGSDKYCNVEDLLETPPESWSKEVIYGYAVWAYLVVITLDLDKLNAKLHGKLMNLFKQFKISELSSKEQLEIDVVKYYQLIKNCE